MLWRRSLYATAALAASAVALYPNPSMLPFTSEAHDEQAAATLPFNDTEIDGGGSIRPVGIPGGKDTDKSVITKRDEQYAKERGDGITEECPSCPTLFGKLEQTRLGTNVQVVQLQVRGEAKSGTSFMFEWAINALAMTCQYLGQLYGEGSCGLGWNGPYDRRMRPRKMNDKESVIGMKIITMHFEPKSQDVHRKQSLSKPAACTCGGVDRVVVKISHLFKHDLPVEHECAWQHNDYIADEGIGCLHVGGRPVQNYTDVLGCMKENPCRLTDDRLQMLVLRDPRAVVVSSYFWLLTRPTLLIPNGQTLEEYVLKMLPTICQYVHLRYVLLHEEMSERTEEFEYEDSVANPLEWHQRWLAFVGLNLPERVVLRKASDKNSKRQYSFAEKGFDEHPGGKSATPSRSFRDEVSEEFVAEMDRIARIWLPPNLLGTFGIPLE